MQQEWKKSINGAAGVMWRDQFSSLEGRDRDTLMRNSPMVNVCRKKEALGKAIKTISVKGMLPFFEPGHHDGFDNSLEIQLVEGCSSPKRFVEATRDVIRSVAPDKLQVFESWLEFGDWPTGREWLLNESEEAAAVQLGMSRMQGTTFERIVRSVYTKQDAANVWDGFLWRVCNRYRCAAARVLTRLEVERGMEQRALDRIAYAKSIAPPAKKVKN